MKYYVTIEDRVVEVELDDATGNWNATIEGKVHQIDLTSITSDSLFSLIVDNASHEILVEDNADHMAVTVDGELFNIVVQDQWQWRLSNIQRKDVVATGETTVRAPMPGAVLSVSVVAGDRVVRGDGLLILSAMKMENEIRSPRAGVILTVHIASGDKVEQNANLITIGTPVG